MNFTNDRQHASPARWVPTLYFAEGLPFYTVSLMALIFYQRVGVSNEVIALTTSLSGTALVAQALVEPIPGDVQDQKVLCGVF